MLFFQEHLNTRKNQLKEISNYNYVTGKALLDAIKNEKKKNRQKENTDNTILNKVSYYML